MTGHASVAADFELLAAGFQSGYVRFQRRAGYYLIARSESPLLGGLCNRCSMISF